MTAKLDYTWRLREIMATRGMFSTTDIRPLLIERGITLSPTQVWRLVTEKPERLSLKVLVALMDILDCAMEELIVPTAAASRRAKAVGGNPGSATGQSNSLGALRPKRARITE
ncbi:helix-turn-helix domain-containing protein [Embleya sp. NPDC055664]